MAGLVENPVLIPFPQNEKIAVHTPRDPPVVRWNGGRSSNPSAIGWLRETLKDSPIVEMRRRYEEDGYILIKGLIPREVVLDMREHYFTHMRSTGLIAPGSDPRDGLFDFSSSPEEFNSIGAPSYPDRTKLQAMAAAHCTPEYLDFLQNPQMREFVRQFMGWGKEVLLARTLLRHCVPHGISLAIHYDKIFLRGGNPANDFLTASTNRGQLHRESPNTTARRTTQSIQQEHGPEWISGTDAQEFYEAEGRDFRAAKEWLTADYEAGDVIFHDPYIVHGTTLNEDKLNRIRLSTDLRFYQEGTSVDERWTKVWMPTDGL
ncbi:uncharacterized protein Z520_01949 [Fonsecaea multimorphosa CBS 102226]|uniref:Uncharacterized protein n=1 Tax=Fonsecaea multimorphosa CBS 102226 TaxID=1442371 RepID=A0A0D2HIS4_9EURO|nr:uncharacterized protein Z520_01949 [Fonsecaea multimorphosa CBS 102226]KIY01811.1 hypothetical protein Z520_01949 [Fonsecaea multimorphosa CBS 102226]